MDDNPYVTGRDLLESGCHHRSLLEYLDFMEFFGCAMGYSLADVNDARGLVLLGYSDALIAWVMADPYRAGRQAFEWGWDSQFLDETLEWLFVPGHSVPLTELHEARSRVLRGYDDVRG